MKVIEKLSRSSFKDREEFENLNMNEKEYIVTYFLRVNEVVNAITGLVK
jgi:hypothetical protein